MANTEFSYVRTFETTTQLPPSNFIIIRIDGRAFTKLCKTYSFTKPNDLRAIHLMNAAATNVVSQFADITLAYGESDEYSFIFHESTQLFDRRESKLITSVVSAFTAEYCLLWPRYFQGEGMELRRPLPTFDGRAVCYPKRGIVRDYLKWRQADCHINNLYNTVFWALVLKGGVGEREAEEELKGTLAKDKNEILWARFGVNYNNEEEVFRKGTVVYRAYDDWEEGKGGGGMSRTQLDKERKRKMKARIAVEHVDIIGDAFWEARPYILAARRGEDHEE